SEFSMALAQRSARLLNQLEQGELAFTVRHEGLEEVVHRLQRMINQLTLTILLSAIIVALGLVMVVYHPPGWEQYGGWVFGTMFLLALASGVGLIWRIWRSGKQ